MLIWGSTRTKQQCFHCWAGRHGHRLRRCLCRLFYHHCAIFQTANQTGHDEFTLCHLCYRICGRAADRRRIHPECDLALVVKTARVSLVRTSKLILNSFYINLPCGLVAAVAMLFAFQAPKAAAPTPASLKEKLLQMDILGAVFICATIVCFTLALRWAGGEKAWTDPDVVGTLVATPVFLVLFRLDQWLQGGRALIMPGFLKNRVLVVGAVFEFL